MKRKILPMLLALCTALCGPVRAAEPQEEAEARIVGVHVAAEQTIEVGVEVGGAGQPAFSGVGVVLAYDKDRLRPIDWESGGAQADLVAAPPGWKPVDVYAPAWVNDAAAQVYTGSADKGYLALQAGTEFPYTLPEARQVVTIKLAYTGDAPKTLSDCGIALCTDYDIALSSRIQHVGLYAAADDAFYYHTPLRTGAFGQAEEDAVLASSQKLRLTLANEIQDGASQQPAGGYSVVFNLMGGAVAALPVAEGETAPELTDAIRNTYQTIGGLQAGDEVVIPKLPEGYALMKGKQTSVTFHDGTKTYQAGDKFTMPDYSVSFAVVWSETASSDDFRSVALLDWQDDMIGTVTINKMAGGAEIKAAVDAVAATLYSGDMAKITAEDYLDAETYDADVPGKMLTYKKGYNFMGWVQTTADTMSDTWTAFDTKAAFTEAGGDALFAKTQPDTEDGAWGNMYLKAGYVGNAMLNAGVSGGQRAYYNIVCDEMSRYGASASDNAGNYVLRVTVRRENAAGYGVTRLKKPVVRAQMTTVVGEATVFSKADLSGDDTASAEVIVPKGMSTVILVIVDEASSFSYVTASGMSVASNSTYYKEDQNGKKGFVYEGSLTFVNEQAELYSGYLDGDIPSSGHAWMQVVYQTFKDLELEEYVEKLEANDTRRSNVAKLRLLLMFAAKNDRRLSIEEMQDAMKLDLGNKVPQNMSINNLKILRNALKDAVLANGNELTNEQIEEIVRTS